MRCNIFNLCARLFAILTLFVFSVSEVCSNEPIIDKFEFEVKRQATLMEKHTFVLEKYFEGKWWVSKKYVQKWTAGLKKEIIDIDPEYKRIRKEWFFKISPQMLSAMNPVIKVRERIDPVEYYVVRNYWFSWSAPNMVRNEKEKSNMENDIYKEFFKVDPDLVHGFTPIGRWTEQSIKRKFFELMKWYEAYDMKIKPKDCYELTTIPSEEIEKFFTGEAGVLFQHFVSVVITEDRTQRTVDLFNRKLSGTQDVSLGNWRTIGGGNIAWIDVSQKNNGGTKVWVGLSPSVKDNRPNPILFRFFGLDGVLINEVKLTPVIKNGGWIIDHNVEHVPFKMVHAIECSSI